MNTGTWSLTAAPRPPPLPSVHRLLYNHSGAWSDSTVPILATTAAGFTYIAFLMVSGSSNIYPDGGTAGPDAPV